MNTVNPFPLAPWADDETRARQEKMSLWLVDLRDRICASFLALETESDNPLSVQKEKGVFKFRPWLRRTESGRAGGGGEMGILKDGKVFEKAGVNVSGVLGTFSPLFVDEIPGAKENDGKFWACGLSMVVHPRSPLVPAFHMNVRMLTTTHSWFGGVCDLNPPLPCVQDTEAFHHSLENLCSRHPHCANYPHFQKACDNYFHIKHRDKARGVGGIFFDNLRSNQWQWDFDFVYGLGENFFDLYPPIVRRHMEKPWTPQQREVQLHYRGLYAEFNLIYDRGTRFGLMTGADPEAVLMSLPPLASW